MATYEELNIIKRDIMAACQKIWAFQTGGQLSRPQIQQAFRQEMININRSVKLDFLVTIKYQGNSLGKPQRIDMVVDHLIGICIVRGQVVTEKQRDTHRLRIQQGGLPMALVISMDGDRLRWRQIDVPGNIQGGMK